MGLFLVILIGMSIGMLFSAALRGASRFIGPVAVLLAGASVWSWYAAENRPVALLFYALAIFATVRFANA